MCGVQKEVVVDIALCEQKKVAISFEKTQHYLGKCRSVHFHNSQHIP